MKHYIAYFKYMFAHKYYVAIECFKHRLIWRGIMHDWDKLLPSNIVIFSKVFKSKNYHTDYKNLTINNKKLQLARKNHYTKNKHHWQYWVLNTDNSEIIIEMDKNSALEMVFDWIVTARAKKKTKIVIPKNIKLYRKTIIYIKNILYEKGFIDNPIE